MALGLPLTYTLIYAPRDEAEVGVDAAILDAAITYMAGTAAAADHLQETPHACGSDRAPDVG